MAVSTQNDDHETTEGTSYKIDSCSGKASQRLSYKKLTVCLVALFFIANAAVIFSNSENRGALQTLWTESFYDKERPGFHIRQITDANGDSHKYALFVPRVAPGKDGYPVILKLNGLGENGNDGIRTLKSGFGPSLLEISRSFPFIVVFPQCHENENWDADGTAAARALDILKKTQDEFPTNRDKVYLTGVSSGGRGAWEMAKAYPGYFAAAVPISSGYDPTTAPDFVKSRLPIWSFYVNGDKQSIVDSNRELKQRFLAQGSPQRFTELNGTLSKTWSKHNGWDYAYRNPALYMWLLEQSRSKNHTKQIPFDTLAGNARLLDWNTGGKNNWKLEEGRTLVNELRHEDAASFSTTGKYHQFELRYEFRFLRGESHSLEFGVNESDKHRPACRLTFCSPHLGSGEIVDGSTGETLVSSSPLAQKSLHESGWNDIRIIVSKNDCMAFLDGWKLFETKLPASRIDNQSISFFVSAGNQVAFRDFAIRNNDEAEQ